MSVTLSAGLFDLFRWFAPTPSAASPRPPEMAASMRATRVDLSTLATDLASQKAADLDYQILRLSFALDRYVDEGVQFSTQETRVDAPDLAAGALSWAGRFSGGARLDASWSETRSIPSEVSVKNLSITQSFDATTLLQLSRRLDLNMGVSMGVQVGDPLVLDLSGKGIATTGVEDGVRFDLNGDGQEEQVSFVTGDSWALALDQNGNGLIDDGHELFGDQNGAAHGFDELSGYDDNGDGVINAQDEVFSRLRLLQIAPDGSQVQRSLEEASISEIETGYQNVHKALDAYDTVVQTGHFTRADGEVGTVADVLLGYRSLA